MAVTFTDGFGTRHKLELSPADQKRLLELDSQRQQEQFLLANGYLEHDIPEEAPPTEEASAESAAALAELQAVQGRLEALTAEVQDYATAEQLGALQKELQLWSAQAARLSLGNNDLADTTGDAPPATQVAELADPEQLANLQGELTRWSAQAARVSLSHSELAAVADQTVERCEAVAKAAQDRLNALAADQAAMAQAVTAQLEESRSESRGAVTEATRKIDAALDAAARDALSEARSVAAQQVGPQGLPGAATVLSLEDPLEVDAESFANRWLGRGLVDGDGVLVIKKDAILVRRWVDQRWTAGPSIEPKTKLVSARISALDASTKTISSTTSTGTGKAGASPDVLKTFVGNPTGSVRMASLDRYAAAGYTDLARSALISAEVTVVDGGPLAGMRGSYLISASLNSGGASEMTVYAMTGELAAIGSPDFEIHNEANYSKPATLTGTFPPNPTVACWYVGWLPRAGTSQPTQVDVRGWCKWNLSDRIVAAEQGAAWELKDEL